MDDKTKLAAIMKAVPRALEAEAAYLAGPKGRGPHRLDSDYDLTIVVPDSVAPGIRVDVRIVSHSAFSSDSDLRDTVRRKGAPVPLNVPVKAKEERLPVPPAEAWDEEECPAERPGGGGFMVIWPTGIREWWDQTGCRGVIPKEAGGE